LDVRVVEILQVTPLDPTFKTRVVTWALQARPRRLDSIPHHSALSFHLPPVHFVAVGNVEPLHVRTAKNHTGETLSVRRINNCHHRSTGSVVSAFCRNQNECREGAVTPEGRALT